MAWEHFPLSAGLWGPPAAVLTELSYAMAERYISAPTFQKGQWIDLPAVVAQLRAACVAAIGQWYWVEDWTNPWNWTIHRLTTGPTTTTPVLFFPEKNVFELAFGNASTDWREYDPPQSSELLNDLYRVLNVLRVRESPVSVPVYSTGYGHGRTSSDLESEHKASCAEALTATDARAWQYNGGSIGHLTSVQDGITDRHWWKAKQSVIPSRWWSENHGRLVKLAYVFPNLTRYTSWSDDPMTPSTYGSTLRSLSFDVRCGTGPDPVYWEDAVGFGTSQGTVTVPPGRGHIQAALRVAPQTRYLFRILCVPIKPTASGSNLCSIVGTWNGKAGAAEYVAFGRNNWPFLIEPDYVKLST